MRRYSQSPASSKIKVFIKKMFMPLSIILFLGNVQDCRGSNEFQEDSCCWMSPGKISEVFRSIFERGLEILPCYRPKGFVHIEGCEIDELTSLENQPLKFLPNEVLYKIAINLSPKDILNLTKTNKLFWNLYENSFWSNYNKEHNCLSWNEKLPEVKVAFSYYWFRNNKIFRASTMGLPLAQEFLKKQKKVKKEDLRVNQEFGFIIDYKRPLCVWDHSRAYFSYTL